MRHSIIVWAIGVMIVFLPFSVGSARATTCSPAGSTGLTALIIAHPHEKVTGTVDATGCDVGIYVGPGVTGVVITHATVKNANDHGILVQDTSHIVIDNSVVTNNQLSPHAAIAEDKAIELVGTSYSVIRHSLVTENNGAPGGGIGISDDGPFNPGALNPGTPMPGDHNIVAGNIVTNNLADCQIVVASYNTGEAVSHNVIKNNYIDNGVTGIVVAADLPNTVASHNFVDGNTVANEFIPGIIIHSNAPGDVVDHNQVTGNTLINNGPDPEVQTAGQYTTGILLAGQVAPVTHSVVNHNIVVSEEAGIWACNVANAPMHGNVFLDVTTAIVSSPTCPPPLAPP